MRTYNQDELVREFAGVANAMNRMFAREFRPYDYARNGGATAPNGEASEKAAYRLPVDVWSDENSYFVAAYVPGVDPDKVEITFEGEELRIKGEFESKKEEVQYVKSELFRGAFERVITFNVPVNAEAIEAEYANGAVTLRVPKAEAAKPKQIKITARN